MSRACVQCTLLCADPAASCCSLCGGALTKTFNRSLNSGTCIDLDDDSQQEVGADCARQKSRACPRCTLICESDLCDACGAEMEPLWVIESEQHSWHGTCKATLFGHHGALVSVDFSPDDRLLVTASSSDNSGRIWCLETEECVSVLEGYELNSARFTADGLKILTACSWCDCALLWCVETGRVLQRFAPHDAAVLHSSMSHDMSTVATATWDGSLMLWWADSGQLRQKLTGFGEKSKVYVSFSPDDRKVVSAGIHHVAQIWETHGASQRRASSVTLSGHGNSVTSAEFSAEGAWVVTGSYDGTAKIWDSTTAFETARCSEASLLEATGASKADMNRLYHDLHEIGEVAMQLRDSGGRQKLLKKPQPLTAGSVRKALLALSELSGQGVERAKTARLSALLRAAEGSELKWLVRTFLPHMAAGISLEASVLPALGAAYVWHMERGRALAHGPAGPRPRRCPPKVAWVAMSERLTELLNGSAVALALGVCSRTGLLKALKTKEPQTAEEVAKAANLNLRYVEETQAALDGIRWLWKGKFTVEEHLKVNTSISIKRSNACMLPLLTRCAFNEVVSAARAGGGVAPGCYGDFGAWMGASIANSSRLVGKLADEKHEKQLISKLLPLLEGGAVFAKLESGGAAVLDVGCGEGTAACLPGSPVADGRAQRRAEGKGLTNVRFLRGDAAAFAQPEWLQRFDLAGWGMGWRRPEDTLREVRKVLKADGIFVMVDIRAETGVAKNLAHPMAPFLYTVSLMHCMPQGMNDGGPGLGMMWGRQKALSMLSAAGFDVQVVEMDFDTFNDCYLCRPTAGGGGGPSADAVRTVQEEVRHGYALRPDVHALVEALLSGGVEALRQSCTLQLGVPMQPMLAKACSSIPELLKRILGSIPGKAEGARLSAEFKYDGQRAQIHVLNSGDLSLGVFSRRFACIALVKIFSRKMDDMTYKYPDVVSVIKRSQKTTGACVLDAEIVAVVPKDLKEAGDEKPSTKRSDCWLKLKKDYLDAMGDSLDLIPIGGWRGSGRKSRWISPWLMATYDPTDGTLGSVCRVMSGFSDKFYKENTLRYLGRELDRSASRAEASAGDEAEGCEGEDDASDEQEAEEEEDADGGAAPLTMSTHGKRQTQGGGLQLKRKAEGVDTAEEPPFWFQPTEVWEIRGADITISPKHMAAKGLVDSKKGLSLRFPRFMRKREDGAGSTELGG
eukprot:g15092.t1